MDAVTIDPEIQGGTPCFTGTRVPVDSLFDHLADGVPLDEFLSDFPTVRREQAETLLRAACKLVAREAAASELTAVR